MESAGCRIWSRATECSFCFAFLPVFDVAVWFWLSSGHMLMSLCCVGDLLLSHGLFPSVQCDCSGVDGFWRGC